MQVQLRLFLDWGIRFKKPYEVPEKAQRKVAYANKDELEAAILRKHPPAVTTRSERPQPPLRDERSPLSARPRQCRGLLLACDEHHCCGATPFPRNRQTRA